MERMTREINGKILVFTDIHFGRGRQMELNLETCRKVIDTISNTCKTESIENIFFLGDWFHNRESLDVNSIFAAYQCMQTLAQSAKIHLILGNHDMYLKNSSDISSAIIFSNIPNIRIYSSQEEVVVNGKKCLFAPWFSDFSKYGKKTFDFMFGHFDLPSKFFRDSFASDNSNDVSTNDETVDEISSMGFFSDGEVMHSETSDDDVDNLIGLLKSGGTLFSGHIHQHREYKRGNKKIIFVGSPWQQDRNERESIDGFYILNENMKYSFREIKSTPRIMDISVSEIINSGIEKYDFSKLHGNIIHLVYDCPTDQYVNAQISKEISTAAPFYEIEPEIKTQSSLVTSDEKNVADVRQSKFEILMDFVNGISQEVLKEHQYDSKESLMNRLVEYYNQASNS